MLCFLDNCRYRIVRGLLEIILLHLKNYVDLVWGVGMPKAACMNAQQLKPDFQGAFTLVMSTSIPTASILVLSQYSPCDIADALIKFGDAHGGFLPNLTQYSFSKQSFHGPAFTVTYAPLDDPRPAVKGTYIDLVPAGAILVIGLTRDAQISVAPYVKSPSALYGGLMSTRAKYLKAAGTVVLGRIRDVQEHRDLEYPVYAYGLGVTSPKSFLKVVALNEPIEIVIEGRESPEIVSPGDLIVGDEFGVVRVPASKQKVVEQVIEYLPRRAAADALVAQDIGSGKTAADSMRERRKGL